MTGESTKLHERLGIVGSGTVARGLANTAAHHLDVVMWARSRASAELARGRVRSDVRVLTELESLADSTLVVEAIVEDAQAKSELLRRLHGVLAPGSLLASTTSSLSIGDLARASGRPDRFAGLHVFNPVEKMRLVEIAFPAAATEDTRARIAAFCELLGKTPVEVSDSPGFVVNRLLFPYLFEAVRLMEREGLEPGAVDTCMTLGAGHPIGPLGLLDLVGLDVAAAIGDSIGSEVPERVRSLVSEGRLGRKSGAGFFEYPEVRARAGER